MTRIAMSVGLAMGCAIDAAAQPAWIPIQISSHPTTNSGEAMDINDQGDVAGYVPQSGGPSGGAWRAFLWTQGDGLRTLSTLGGASSYAFGINDARQVVGSSDATNGYRRAFVWSANTGMVDLGALLDSGQSGPGFSEARAINNLGDVIGTWSATGSALSRVFRWNAATGMVDLTAALGATGFAVVYDINDAGQIVGADQRSAFVWTPTGGRMDFPADVRGQLSNNALGQVAGTRNEVVNGQVRVVPFVWSATTGMTAVTVLQGPNGPEGASAQGIDASGRVALVRGLYSQTMAVVSSVGGPVEELWASNTWVGYPRAISAAGVVGRTPEGAHFWCRGGPPEISGAAATPNVLQPAQGQLVTVRLDYAARGRCGRTTTALEVESSEADEGNPDGLPDAIVVDANTVRLRAEHRAAGPGRTYTVRIRSTDDFGYTAVRTVTVTVPVSGGTPMTGVTLSTSVATPQTLGTTVVLSAVGSGGTPPYAFRFSVRSWTTGVTQVLCDWSTSASCGWTPAVASGYDVLVDARRSQFTSGVEVQAATTFQINPGGGGGGGPMTSVTLTSNVPSPQATGTTVLLTATGSGGQGPYAYRFWVQSHLTGVWQLAQDWSGANTFAWTPTVAGGYNLWVDGRRSASSGAEEARTGTNFVVSVGSGGGGGGGGGPMTGLALTSNLASPQATGTTVLLTATGSGGQGPYSYRFWVQSHLTGVWQLAQDWSGASTFAWTPTVAGGYNLWVDGRRSASSGAEEVRTGTNFVISAGSGGGGGGGGGGPMTAVSLTTSVVSPQAAGTTVLLTATGSGGQGPYAYRFWVQSHVTGVWQLAQDWSGASTLAWTPTVAGGYNLWVDGRRSASTGAEEARTGINFVVR